MNTHFITVDNAWPALKEKGIAGPLRPAEAYPLHAVASDLHYTILPSGVLTCLFSAAKSRTLGFSRILDSLPASSGLQLYTHHHPEKGERDFLALSALVDYRSPFSPFQGFGSLLSGGVLSRELERLEGATRETYDMLRRCVQPDAPALELLGNPTPLLQILGPLRLSEVSLECKETIAYNLSYLLLGPSRLALLVEFNAFPAAGAEGIPRPPEDMEYLSATCIHLPHTEDLARMDAEVEEYLAFLHFFRRVGARAQAGFPLAEGPSTGPGVSLKGRVTAKHYALLFGGTLSDLRLKAQEYFRELCRARISFHASMIRTRKNYSHLYPGNFRVLEEGIRIEASRIPSLLGGLHP
jgi:hypothetical protein